MSTTRLTVAQALVRFLNNQYIEVDGKEQLLIKGIFTIFGHGNVVGLGQALEQEANNLVVHQGRNEQGMAHAATAFAKQKHRKQVYAVTSSVGPGAANMVTAAATATANNIPVLLLPGDTFATRQPDPVLQQVEQSYDLTISTNDSFKAVSRYWNRVSRPEQLMSAMIQAMRALTDQANAGAVTVALPQDVQGEAYDFPNSFFEKRVHRLERRPAAVEAISDAVKLIKSSRKPILICGGGVRYSEAAESFAKFAESFNIPWGETQAGKSAIPWDHPLNLGGIGVTGNLASNRLAKDADLVIGVGTRYTDFTTASKQLFQNPNVKYLSINVSEFDAYKLDATRLIADAREALDALTEILQNEGYKSTYTDEIDTARDDWQTELDRLFGLETAQKGFVPEVSGHLDHVLEEFENCTGSNLTQTRVLGVLDEMLDPDAIVVGASGSLPGDLQRVWRPKCANTYHMEYGYSCMGYEISGALGVKLAAPDQEVYALVGDGTYMMLHSELVTAVQERQKINVIVLDNMAFGCINNLQMSQGSGSYGTEFRYRNPETGQLDGELVPIDFAKSAEGYGCVTYSVKTIEELKAAVEDAKKQTASTLIDVKVLPKTMTNGYGAWWRVGTAEVSESPSVQKAYNVLQEGIAKARKY
jgi:3D-(3,5/4)-trihydroxycyclohexane-1,2-dione acylhydrolase (decyclizing)